MITEPDDPLDELLSAYLDDEVTPDERVQVESRPDLRRRVDDLRDVRRRLNDVEIDPDERDLAIAAALAAFDEGDRSPAAAPASVVGTDEVSARRSARRGPNRLIGWIGAAAAMGVAVFALSNLPGGSDDFDAASSDTVASATESDQAESDQAEAATAMEAPASLDEIAGAAERSTDTVAAAETTAAPMESSVAAPPELATADEVRTYVAALTASDTFVPGAAGDDTATEDARFCTLPGGAPSVPLGSIVWQGRPAELLVSPDASDPVKAVVLSADCTGILATVEPLS